jgi:hypothetical protein
MSELHKRRSQLAQKLEVGILDLDRVVKRLLSNNGFNRREQEVIRGYYAIGRETFRTGADLSKPNERLQINIYNERDRLVARLAELVAQERQTKASPR